MGAATAFRTIKSHDHAVSLSPEQREHRRNRVALILAIIGGVGMAISASGLTVHDIIARFPF